MGLAGKEKQRHARDTRDRVPIVVRHVRKIIC